MSEHAQQYNALMADAFVNGLADVASRYNPNADPLFRLYSQEGAIREGLRAVDWDASGLPNITYDETGGDIKFTPREQAESLMGHAFADVHTLFDYSLNYATSQDIPLAVSYGQLLHGSKPLLSIARVQDGEKQDLFSTLTQPELRRPLRDFGIELDSTEPMTHVTNERGIIGLRWKPEVQAWIERFTDRLPDGQLDPNHGCPAAGHIITDPTTDRQATLLNYFWDRLTVAAYPEDR